MNAKVRLLRRERNRYIAELQTAGVVPLYVKRSWLAFIRIQSAARDPLNLLMIDRRHSVPNNRHRAAYHRNVETLPLCRLSRQLDSRRDTPIDGTYRTIRRVFVNGFVFNLNFVPPSQEKAAVTILRAIHFKM